MAEKKRPSSKATRPTPATPPAPVATAAPEATDDDPLYTSEQLQARYGVAPEEEVLAFVAGSSKADLVAAGDDVATRRIAKDCRRIYGRASDFLATAKAAQLRHLPVLTETFLRAAITAMCRGEALVTGREQQTAQRATSKQSRASAADALRTKAAAQREVLYAALVALAGNDARRHGALALAYGTGAAAQHAGALAALVKEGRALLADRSPAMALRRKSSRLDEAYLTDAEQLARELAAADKAATAVAAQPEVAQAEVDYWDGVNLWFVDTLVTMFDAGHEADPTIPRLQLITLRNVLRPTAKKPASKPGGKPARPAKKPTGGEPEGPPTG